MKKYRWIIGLLILVCFSLFVRYGLKFYNKSLQKRIKSEFVFTDLINLGCTSVKNQGASNTCWSYTGNSFLESEMIRMGKKPMEISQIYTARQAYLEKARTFVRLHGGLSMKEGGQLHDVLNTYRKYGAMPRSAYSGLRGKATYNDFRELTPALNTMLKVLVKNKRLTSNWERAYIATMDAYLGELPAQFNYEGKMYTPRTFADQFIGINPDDYVGLASVTDQSYYKPFVLLVPDNWSFDRFYNVQMEDLTTVIDQALEKGFTVAWTTDVSDPGFSWNYGIAYVPEKSIDQMTAEEKDAMFVKPQREKRVSAAERQAAFDNWETTDDHAMHIVGLAKDQQGKEYYRVKNSWGKSNEYHGYLYVSKEFVRLKTLTIILHKAGLSPDFRLKLGLS
ncbi:aminopeptidase C [Sphingobacterium multivorum]|uniref:aminopeptidase C n=1 Tax=Sphingobacterium multivorum TaxID=28454 RepID=UPI0028A9BF82|nr:C1 family peptidase [Sphingobacterium multivorum]